MCEPKSKYVKSWEAILSKNAQSKTEQEEDAEIEIMEKQLSNSNNETGMHVWYYFLNHITTTTFNFHYIKLVVYTPVVAGSEFFFVAGIFNLFFREVFRFDFIIISISKGFTFFGFFDFFFVNFFLNFSIIFGKVKKLRNYIIDIYHQY